MDQIVLHTIMQHVKGNHVMKPNPHGFMKGKSCLENLISFYNDVALLVDEGKAVNVAYLSFSKASDAVFHSILPEKLTIHGWIAGCFPG